MTQAQSQAQVQEAFIQHIDALVDYASRAEEASLNQEPSLFYEPPTSDWDGELTDVEGMSAAFDREALAEDFRHTLQDDGVKADLELVVLQSDFIARLERAYRARHLDLVRSRTQAAVRHRSHRHDNGVLKRGILGHMEHLKNMGSS